MKGSKTEGYACNHCSTTEWRTAKPPGKLGLTRIARGQAWHSRGLLGSWSQGDICYWYSSRKRLYRSSSKANHPGCPPLSHRTIVTYITLPLPRFTKWKSHFLTIVFERFVIHYILLDHSTLILVLSSMFCSCPLNILEIYSTWGLDEETKF